MPAHTASLPSPDVKYKQPCYDKQSGGNRDATEAQNVYMNKPTFSLDWVSKAHTNTHARTQTPIPGFSQSP